MRGFPPDDLFPRRHAASSGRTHASTVLAVRLQGDLRRLLVAGVRVERGHVEVLANAPLDDADAFARRRLSRRDRPGSGGTRELGLLLPRLGSVVALQIRDDGPGRGFGDRCADTSSLPSPSASGGVYVGHGPTA